MGFLQFLLFIIVLLHKPFLISKTSDLKPYFNFEDYNIALKNLREKNFNSAITILYKIKKTQKLKEDDKKRIDFLIGITYYIGGNCKSAIEVLKPLKTKYELMENHIKFILAKCYYNKGDLKSAKEILKTIAENSSQFLEGNLLFVDILIKENKYIEAAKIIEENFSSFSLLRTNLQKILSDLYFKSGKVDEGERWLKNYIIKNPWLIETENLKVQLDINDKLEMGITYYSLQRGEAAINIFKEIREFSKPSEKLWCDASYFIAGSFDKMRRYKESLPIYDDIIKVCKEGWEKRLDALFKGIRSAFEVNDEDRFKKWFKIMKSEFPQSSYNDDGYIYLSYLYRNKKEYKLAEKTLVEQIKKYPDGDMFEEAHWLLIWDAYKRKAFKKALKNIENGLKKIDKEKFYYSRGRMLYWRGRIYEKVGKKKPAISSYIDCLKKYPLSYYSVLSLSRLKKIMKVFSPDKIIKNVASSQKIPKEKLFSIKVIDNPSFQTVIEFYKLGLRLYLQKEIEFLEKKLPPAPEIDWLIAFLYHNCENYPLSHNIPRRKRVEFQDFYPVENGKDYWLIAYPFPYKEIVKKISSEHKFDEFLTISIIREESGFYEQAISYANALGLMQLLLKTAKRMAKGTKLKVEEMEDLFEPEKNIYLGVKYLSFLKGLFKNPLYFVPAYNAGEGSVSKWKKEIGNIPPDEFVESIPARQARNYTKRVIESYGVYKFLYGGKGSEKYLILNL